MQRLHDALQLLRACPASARCLARHADITLYHPQSYQICSGCIECQCYSDCNWVEAVKRKTDGKEFKICVGPFGCCLEKPEHKDAYESDRADSDRPDSEASSEERSDSESDGAKRKAAKRELADLLS